MGLDKRAMTVVCGKKVLALGQAQKPFKGIASSKYAGQAVYAQNLDTGQAQSSIFLKDSGLFNSLFMGQAQEPFKGLASSKYAGQVVYTQKLDTG